VKSSISPGSQMHRSTGILTRERATYTIAHVPKISCDSQLRLAGVPSLGICAQFLRKLIAKVIDIGWISSRSKFSPWEFSWVPWFHGPRTEKPLFSFWFVLHDSVYPLPARIGCQYFWSKRTDPLPKWVYRLKAG
jgi:hypothetical protein